MPATNKPLNKAKEEEENEYYTKLSEIEKELTHYEKDNFEGKIVYCNCDDPLESNFFIYFVKHFRELGLKKLITTCFDGSPIAGSQLLLDFEETRENPKRIAHKIEVDDVEEFSYAGGKITFWDVADALRNGTGKARLEKLRGNGDFQSEECVELLDKADVICTNPPFSEFREYFKLLTQHNKKFLVLTTFLHVADADVFPDIKAQKIWSGWKSDMEMVFDVPPYAKPGDSPQRYGEKNGQKWKSRGDIIWLTNLKLKRGSGKKPLELGGPYVPGEFPIIDSYKCEEVILVEGRKKIPSDYYGLIGVAPSKFPKLSPEQFEIVGCADCEAGRPDHWPKTQKMTAKVNGRQKVKTLLIRRRDKPPTSKKS